MITVFEYIWSVLICLALGIILGIYFTRRRREDE
jgi:uncharacterized protein YneF (UPF0154 family)